MNFKKIVAVTMAAVMLCAVMPLSAFAAVDFNTSADDCDFYNLITKNDYALAPGAVESEIVLNDATGANRNVLHVIDVDLSNPNISIMPTYYGLNENSNFEDSSQWAPQVLTEQAAHVENDLGLNVVGGMNTNLRYDSNHPYGVLVWNGVVYSDERNSAGNSTAQTFLSVTKDGVASLHSASEPIPEDAYNAISANFSWIIKNGVNQYPKDDHADGGRAPRSVMAIKEDGSLILLMNDGRQAPYSAGATMRELAEWLLAMGCVDAVNCDGGGSSTFITEREGTGELTMKSSPSDGGQRPTLGGILVISKAVADGKFHHAAITTDVHYVTPGSTVTFDATGADSAGGPAEIPAEGITWQLADPAMGTVEDGVFTSNGTEGTATVQMVYGGEVVGEASVEVVIPEAIRFTQENITVPYGKTLDISVIATVNNGLNTVVTKAGDFTYTLSDAALGTISGDQFTAYAEPTVTAGTISASFVGTELTTTANLMLGRGSEVMWDFEDADINNLKIQSGYLSKHAAHAVGRGEQFSMELATAETGEVHSGDYALAATMDFSQVSGAGYKCITISGFGIDLTDAVALGMWIYLPTEAVGLELDIVNAIPLDPGEISRGRYTEDNWYYISATKDNIAAASVDKLSFYFTDGYDASLGDVNIQTKFTIYIDDITVDYSTVVDDREPPVFSGISMMKDADTYVAIDGQTVTNNTLTILAEAIEDTTKSNYTGLDTTSAKMFVDGQEIKGVSCASNGTISSEAITLSDGTHTIRFEISDNLGNVGVIHRLITVDTADSEPVIEFVPADAEATQIPIGSVYWMNLEVANIEKIQKVETVIDLDGISSWELDYMEIAEGFTATYSIDKDNNNATIVFEKTGATSATGAAVLASMPIRTWYYQIDKIWADCYESGDGYFYSPAGYWSDGSSFPNHVAICVNVDAGKVTFTDGSAEIFGSAEYVIDTELYQDGTDRTQTQKEAKASWHIHTPVAIEDKAATCTENGYTGRTVCVGCSCGNTADKPCDSFDGCGSVVDWGTVIPADGHTYVLSAGKLVCSGCGAVDSTYNGFWQDANGWAYFLDGAAARSWVYIDGNWHFFNANYYAATGTQTISGREYRFEGEQGKSLGAWDNGRYYFHVNYVKNSWVEIDGATYYFENSGYYCSGTRALTYSGNFVGAYEFDAEGKLIAPITGVFCDSSSGVYYYAEDGEIKTGLGLIKIGVSYYYVRSNGVVVSNASWYVDKNNAYGFAAGTYDFGPDGKMLIDNGIVDKDGVLYYYVDGVLQTGLGLIELEGEYYYVGETGEVLTNATSFIDADNAFGLMAGTYTFGADGKLAKTGFITDAAGATYYLDNLVVVKGVTKLGDDYYYFYAKTGKMYADTTLWVGTNDAGLASGHYYFGADGKLVKTGFVTTDAGITYYYDNLEMVKGFTKIGDDFYYFHASNGKMLTETYCWVTTNDYGVEQGKYYFQADGKLHVADPNGEKAVVEIDGKWYFTIDGIIQILGLYEMDGNYYFANAAGVLRTNCVIWIPSNNGYIPAGNYNVGENGMVEKTGFVAANGKIFYRENLELVKGFKKVGEDYYYFGTGTGNMSTDSYLWIGANDYGVPTGRYYFGVDGKMVL